AEFEPSIKALLAKQVRGSYVIAAAGATAGTTDLNIRGEASSAYRDVDGSDSEARVRKVPIRTLDQLCEERDLHGPYLIKVDVQGAELNIVTNAPRILVDTGAVILEVSLLQVLERAHVFTELVRP